MMYDMHNLGGMTSTQLSQSISLPYDPRSTRNDLRSDGHY